MNSEPGTDEIRGKHGTGHYTGGARHDRDLRFNVEKTKGTGGMTTCNKAQANTSRPEEARLRLPDPGHNLPRDGEPAFSSLSFLLAYLALVLVTLPLF